MIQIIDPNPNIACRPGWCLQYVRQTYGIDKPVYPSATAAWNATQFKHLDKNFPSCDIPVWFSVKDVPAGHVALRMSDGSVYSCTSPTSNTPMRFSSLDALINYYARSNPLTYLGWSEDIENVRVVKEEEMGSQSLADETTIRLEYNNGLGRDANASEIQSAIDNNLTVEGIQRLISNSKEHAQLLKDQQLGYKIRASGIKKLDKGVYEV